ncbi:MAG: hypothetical protein WCJ39_01150 [bacterium]
MKSIDEATKYIHNIIKEMNPEVQEAEIYETILEEVLETADVELSEHDIEVLDEHNADLEFIDKFLQKKVPDYQELLTEIVEDMISDED